MTDWRSKAPRPKLDQELKNIMDREPNMPTYQEMVEQKRASVREVDARESARRGLGGLDRRDPDQLGSGSRIGGRAGRGFRRCAGGEADCGERCECRET